MFAEALAGEHDLHVIESESAAIQRLESFDLQVVVGNSTNLTVLQEAGIEKADHFIACHHSDEVNLLSCLAVKQLGKAKTFCFVNKAHYFETFAGELGEHLVIDRLIWPEMFLGEYIARIIRVPGAIDVKNFDREDLKLLEFKIKPGDPSIDRELKTMNLPKGALAVALFRGEEVVIPGGLTTLKVGDKIIFMGNATAMRKVENRFNPAPGKSIDLVVIGGGNVGSVLIKSLEPFTDIRIRLIESSMAVCQALSGTLSDRVLILHGDGSDAAFLKSQQIENCDCLVTLTGSDERNLMISMHAKNQNVRKIVTRAHSPVNIEFFESLGIDVASSAQLNAVQSVIRQMSGDSIDVFTMFEKDKAAIKEVEVPKNFAPTRLMDLKLPEGTIIAAIRRGGQTIVPSGLDKIKGDDLLRVFQTIERNGSVVNLLTKRIEKTEKEDQA